MAFRARAVVAFDQGALCGAVVARGAGGRRVRAAARVPLPEGVLRATPFEDNVLDPGALGDALGRLSRELRLAGGVCLVLPDGLAFITLLQVPAGVAPAEYARHRLRAVLPYPPEEAVVDVLKVGQRRVLAAAVRRPVVESYEAAAATAGLEQDRLDLAPLCALGALMRAPAVPGTVDVVLGDAAVSLAVPVGGTLAAYRNRRRDPGTDEPRRLLEEAARTAALAAVEPSRLRVVGAGAAAAVSALRAAGAVAEAGWNGGTSGRDAGELAWLSAAV